MFTKNIKLIGIVALIVVIVMVLSAVIAINNDKKVSAELDSAVEGIESSYEKKIAELNAAIESLKTALNKAQSGLADAEAVNKAQKELIDKLGAVNDDWAAATVVVVSKIQGLEDAIDAFQGQFDEVEGLEFNDAYNYDAYETMYEAYEEAVYTLLRATTIDEMDAIVAAFAATLDEIPTRIEIFYAHYDAVVADGITYEEKEAIEELFVEFFSLNGNLFAPSTESGNGEKEVVFAALNEVYAAWRETVVAKFVASVNALPTFWAIVDTDAEAIDAAADVLVEIAEAYNYDLEAIDAALAGEEAAAAVVTLERAQARVENVKLIKERAEAVNALIDAEFEIVANVASHDYVRALQAALAAWVNGSVDETTSIVSLMVITNAEDERFNETIYNYVNHEAIETAVATYDAAVAQLVSDFQAFIDAVDAIGEITLESKAALDAAEAAYIACISGVTAEPEIFDILVDAEEGKGLNNYYAEYHELRVAYDALVVYDAARTACINKINAALHALANCTEVEGVHTHGTVVYSEELDGKLTEIDNMIARELLAIYAFDVEALDEELFAYYYEAKLVIAKEEAKKAINSALEGYVGHEKYAELEASVETQIATVNSVTLEKYELEVALDKVASYGDAEFIQAQFNTIIEK